MEIAGYQSKTIKIGDLGVGGTNPMRVQSMTSTPTLDTEATVQQSIRMIEAGCELVRITAPFVKEAIHLKTIKEELRKRGYKVPLIADIHYLPKAAEIAARIVEKVRINPGNYVDRKLGKLGFSKNEYQEEIEKIAERLQPLLKICKENGTVLRIGSNHGSLSERIMHRFGNTATGMVESAMEFIEICEDFGFKDLVLSMKASDVKVMVQANRLLVKRMLETNRNYPLHLGVTEAGDGEDGRIKSAAGIGSLLMDGIGDTIRVSLTEDPEFEIPVAKELAKLKPTSLIKSPSAAELELNWYAFNRSESKQLDICGGNKPPVVVGQNISKNTLPDYRVGDDGKTLYNTKTGDVLETICIRSIKMLKELLASLPEDKALVFDLTNLEQPVAVRQWFADLKHQNITNPVILKKTFTTKSKESFMVEAGACFGYFLVDGLGDGIWLENKNQPAEILTKTAFNILQSTGLRITKTDYIACPSCGRTLFNIQETLKRIKSRTNHLQGLKIGVMGCCVNGPGEMADAHYGYVGAGKGKVTLYKGKKIMQTGLAEEGAVDALIQLIKDNGDWQEIKR